MPTKKTRDESGNIILNRGFALGDKVMTKHSHKSQQKTKNKIQAY